MLATRRATGLRAAVAKTVLIQQCTATFEALEHRVLMCGTNEQLLANGVPESLIENGHILRSEYEKLDAKVQAHIDPHWVQDDPNPNLYAQPGERPTYASLEQVRAEAGRSNMVEALPDFFPLMYTGTSIDQTTQSGRTLMRFGTQVNNQGLGPGSFISRDAGAPMPTDAPIVDPITSWFNADGSQNVLQKVYSWNPTAQNYTPMYYRAAGRVSYHSNHGHLHYEGYAGYRLRTRLGNGQPGDYMQRADGTGIIGGKVGFCLLTFSGTFTTEQGTSSSTLPGYNRDLNDSNGQPVPDDCGYNQGVRVGHYDQYSSGLEGQWIDITGVPSGQYFVEITMDDSNMMSETNETNNAKNFAVTIGTTQNGGITPDQFDAGTLDNDTWDNATDMGDLGVLTQTGLNVHWGYDLDYFKFDATSTGTGTIATTPAGTGSGNVDLYLYDKSGQSLKQSTLLSGTDTVSWSFTKGEEYYIKAQTYNSTTSTNYQIAWNIKPTVSYAAPDNSASEVGQQTGMFNVARNGPVTSPVAIGLTIGGTAIRDVDYVLSSPNGTLSGNNLTIGNLASNVNIIVTPIADGIREGNETVTLTIANGTNFVSDGGTFTVTITERIVPRPPIAPTPPVSIKFNGNRLIGDEDTDRLHDGLLAF